MKQANIQITFEEEKLRALGVEFVKILFVDFLN